MAQAVLNSLGGAYTLGPATGQVAVDVLTVPASSPAVGRSSIIFTWASSVNGTGHPQPPSSPYFVTFTPNVGLPFSVTGSSIGFIPTNQNSNYAMYGVAIEDVSGGDSVASGGVITLGATLGGSFPTADVGVCGAVVFQADSPVGFRMRPVVLGTFPFSGVVTSSATLGPTAKSTGPFITLVAYAAANGGTNPVFGAPSDPSISLTFVNEFQANNATVAYYTYVSPTSWGWSTTFWFLLPPSSPNFTIPTTWTGATNIYGGETVVIAHQPIVIQSGSGTSRAGFGLGTRTVLLSGTGTSRVGLGVGIIRDRRQHGRTFAHIIGAAL